MRSFFRFSVQTVIEWAIHNLGLVLTPATAYS
jgi:hypothetical protein